MAREPLPVSCVQQERVKSTLGLRPASTALLAKEALWLAESSVPHAIVVSTKERLAKHPASTVRSGSTNPNMQELCVPTAQPGRMRVAPVSTSALTVSLASTEQRQVLPHVSPVPWENMPRTTNQPCVAIARKANLPKPPALNPASVAARLPTQGLTGPPSVLDAPLENTLHPPGCPCATRVLLASCLALFVTAAGIVHTGKSQPLRVLPAQSVRKANTATTAKHQHAFRALRESTHTQKVSFNVTGVAEGSTNPVLLPVLVSRVQPVRLHRDMARTHAPIVLQVIILLVANLYATTAKTWNTRE